MTFADRADAGRALAAALARFRDDDVVVLGLPRGGVQVAFEVAEQLRAPLDLVLVRKLGVPAQPELAMGAIGEDDVRVVNDDVVRAARVGAATLQAVEDRERQELGRRRARLRGQAPRLSWQGRVAIVVDDGVATGATARVACAVARAHGARKVVLAVPVASPRTAAALRADADEVVCLETPVWFHAVGQAYRDFSQLSDAEVADLLARARRHRGGSGADREVGLAADEITLPARLTVPAGAHGLVVFAHGSGSSRHSPRNRAVAARLNRAGIATVLLDLLTGAESGDRALAFDIGLLADRLRDAAASARELEEARRLPLGLFGASTGAAAALTVAADPEAAVVAVVSRGGRPDLAGAALTRVRAPTLLIVGERDETVLELNRRALALIPAETSLVVVPGATHLFEEPGTLDRVADQATEWFLRHLAA